MMTAVSARRLRKIMCCRNLARYLAQPVRLEATAFGVRRFGPLGGRHPIRLGAFSQHGAFKIRRNARTICFIIRFATQEPAKTAAGLLQNRLFMMQYALPKLAGQTLRCAVSDG